MEAGALRSSTRDTDASAASTVKRLREIPRQQDADPVQVLQIIARIGRLPETAYCLNKRCRQDVQPAIAVCIDACNPLRPHPRTVTGLLTRPNVVRLKLCGSFRAHVLAFPDQLEQLTLSGGFAGDVRQSALLTRLTSVTLHRVHHDPPFDAALAALPPSVTSLTLEGDVSLTEEQFDDGSLQQPQAPAWPPSLTALTIRDAACAYALPPTLLHLSLEVAGANTDARDVPCLTDFSSYALPPALETLSIATRGQLRALPAALPRALRQLRVAAGAVHRRLVALPPLPASLTHLTLSCLNWELRSLGPLPAALQELMVDSVSFDASLGTLPPALRVLKFHPWCRFGGPLGALPEDLQHLYLGRGYRHPELAALLPPGLLRLGLHFGSYPHPLPDGPERIVRW
eukprot:TRINITY_DN7454_c0_g1_i1.p1 TRINITY_DN7454_c0_g1~~TRINITY_DN7454_c0_g1_i1.p1  ORF type:complete len:401 (-),score=83.60 TRINITY_DN7454_c0_g1_i1:347-1549(-)